ncbi:monovalent cation:proton antiporter-2 (CPA2) family protein [Gammaproteobacteria bacterium]|nr:monovalent cation:proton antiporter-2 (CPA2) family protein [Gammaproteobacteria bacterium]
MHTDSLLINALYYLLAAVIAVPLFKRLGLGSILGYLFAGVVLGPHALGIIENPESVLHFAEYGVILLLFVIGLELAPEKLWSMRNHILVLGGSQVLLTGLVIGFGLAMLLALPLALVLGLTLALSSTALAIQLMSEERILASPLGRKGFSILLLQDLAVIPILIAVSVLAPGATGATTPAWYVTLLALVGVVAFGRFGLSEVLAAVARSNNREVMTAASLLIVIGVAVLMNSVGLSMGLGAFLAGIMLANSDYRHQLESDIEPFKGMLLGLFFIAIGMTLNLALLWANPLRIVVLALGLVFVKTAIITAILRWRHVSLKEGVQLGLMLSQGGEFAFVVLSQGQQAMLFDAALAEQLTLIVGLSMAFTSPLVTLYRRVGRSRSVERPDQDRYWDSHQPEVIIAGFGRFGQIIGRLLQARHIPFTAMDKDSAHVEFVKQFGNQLFYGDLTRIDLLRSAGIKHAKILVVAVNDVAQSLAIIDHAREQNSRIKIITRAVDRFHAYELYKRKVDSVVRETFASSLEAATDTLEQLGYTEGQALEVAKRFRLHDEELLERSAQHIEDIEELGNIARQGRRELELLFEEDTRKQVAD